MFIYSQPESGEHGDVVGILRSYREEVRGKRTFYIFDPVYLFVGPDAPKESVAIPVDGPRGVLINREVYESLGRGPDMERSLKEILEKKGLLNLERPNP